MKKADTQWSMTIPADKLVSAQKTIALLLTSIGRWPKKAFAEIL
jgi:hypothetical protein